MRSCAWLAPWLAVALLAPGVVRAAAPAGVPAALPGAPPLPDGLRRALAAELQARGPDYEPRTRQLHPDGTPRYTNRLLLEASPYLRQHAHNPVDWWPWGDEAFAAARRLERPVLVSIGYSTCHWCHVMEEESFDDPALAEFLNGHFVAIKVDREARPDLDAIYMAAIQAMGQQGGWPLNVFVTPDRRPFYAGTYFPPRDAGGRPGFRRVLEVLHERYRGERATLEDFSEQLAAVIRSQLEGVAADATRMPDPGVLDRAREEVLRRADPVWGGIGQRTKFPSSLPIRFLLREHLRSGSDAALAAARLALDKMAAGGLQDHVGGGFHRYATDRRWLVPHFEKMLYDNALLARVYLDAWQATGDAGYRQVAERTLDYLLREMQLPAGGFASATDADSRDAAGESEEGAYFTWTPEELRAVLGETDAALAAAWFGVRAGGNHEGRSVLHTPRSWAEVAAELGIDEAALRSGVERVRAALLAARSRRPPPLRDDKVLASWNGLAISALARAGFAFEDPRYLAAAERAAGFALGELREDGRLLRFRRGERAGGAAFLEDHAFLIAALLDLYESAPDPRWLREALALQALLDAHYADDEGGGYYRTADDHEGLLAREKPSRDGAIPSGNSVAAQSLLRLAELTGDGAFAERAGLVFSAFDGILSDAPSAVPELLLALDFLTGEPPEIVVVRPASSEGGAGALLAPLRRRFAPNRVVAIATEGADLEAHARVMPLVAGKRALGGRATAYVCRDRVCLYPTVDPAVFERQLLAPP